MTELFAAADGPYLPLYLVTLALHAVFVSYLVGGTVFVIAEGVWRRLRPPAAATDAPSPFAQQIASWLPLAMGAAITAGVAPLLFIQILYQRSFYTANLLLGPVWGLMIPALIIGFYLLYLHKSRPSLRPGLVLGVALACFALVAALWSFNHHIMTEPSRWAGAYRDSALSTYGVTFLRRLPIWFGGMFAQFAVLAAWQAWHQRAAASVVRTLAAVAIGGRAMSVAGAVLLGWQHRGGEPLVVVLIAAAVIDGVLWLAVARSASRAVTGRFARPWLLAGLSLSTAIALLAALGVRERPRLPELRDLPTAVSQAGGTWMFGLFAVLAIAAMIAIIRAVRRAPPAARDER